MRRALQLCLLLWLCLQLPAYAQSAARAALAHLSEPVFAHYGREQGLVSEFANSLAQDGEGMIWIGSGAGLARFDGLRMRAFKHDAEDPYSLQENFITSVRADSLGRIWIGSIGAGVSRFEAAQGRFIRSSIGAQGLRHPGVFSMAPDNSGGMWIATRAGLDHLDANGQRQAPPLELERALNSVGARTLLRGADGRLWLGGAQGLFYVHLREPRLQAISLPSHAGVLLALAQDKLGRIWAGSRSGKLYLIETRGEAREVRLPESWRDTAILSIAETSPGEIWVGSSGQGILQIDAHSLQVREVRHVQGRPAGLADDMVSDILRDRHGLVWLATWAGLQRRLGGNDGIQTLRGAAVPRARSTVSAIAHSRHELWLGMDDGALANISWEHGGSRIEHSKAPQNGLPAARIYALAHQADTHGGVLWIGTDQGLYRQRKGAPPQALSIAGRSQPLSVRAMLLDAAQVWIGAGDGLWHSDASGQLQRPAGTEALQREAIVSMAQDSRGQLWLGAISGNLYRWRPASQELRRIAHSGAALPASGKAVPDQNPTALRLSGPFIATLYADAQQRLWVGLLGGGIDLLHDILQEEGPHTLSHIGSRQGLPDDQAEKILADATGKIWVSTNSGIASIDPRSLQVQSYGSADGDVIGIYWNSGALLGNGDLLFGGVGGVSLIPAGGIQSKKLRPASIISGLHAGAQPLPAGRWHEQQRLELGPSADSLRLEMAAPDYGAPQSGKIGWRLQGWRWPWSAPAPWQESPATQDLRWTNLAPGEYTLELRSAQAQGEWGKVRRLELQIHPRWHQSAWFYTLLALCLVEGVAALVQWRTVALRRQQSQLQQAVRERTEELAQKNHALFDANAALNHSLHELQENQMQLIHAEKMAALGQLVASVAHEVNTPVGAINSSAHQIASQLPAILRDFPALLQSLEPDMRASVLQLCQHALQSLQDPASLSAHNSRTRRELLRQSAQLLEQLGIAQARRIAELLHDLDCQQPLHELLPLLRRQDAPCLLQAARDTAQILQHAGNIAQAVARVGKIVYALRSFAHEEGDSAMSVCDLQQSLENVLTLYRHFLDEDKGVRLKRHYEPCPPLLCQPDQLNQVWANLIHNALQAMAYRGELEIGLRQVDQGLQVWVQDNGCGITPEQMEQIFQPFYSTQSEGQGCGLGLGVTRRIVEQHGGKIEVHSTPGAGSRFVVWLPLQAED
ncbi:ATP-binding protein [Massilia sp. W12]|uniref:ATP-binding protein n=1 Tax=Massilia sp. W12 TaxID=3126507 RepID=UPI0030D61E82